MGLTSDFDGILLAESQGATEHHVTRKRKGLCLSVTELLGFTHGDFTLDLIQLITSPRALL